MDITPWQRHDPRVKQPLRYRRERKGDGLAAGWPGVSSPEETSSLASYIGSPEHKDHPVHPSFGFGTDLRTNNSACPPDMPRERAELALKMAILRGCVAASFVGRFPKYVWARIDDQPYCARLTNLERGQYKGWPITEDELPTEDDTENRLSVAAWRQYYADLSG